MSDKKKSRGTGQGWIATVIVSLLMICAALVVRATRSGGEPEAAPVAAAVRKSSDTSPFLPRTRALVEQKTTSLSRYNQEMPLDELLSFYQKQMDHPVQPDAFEALTDWIVGQVLPNILRDSEGTADGRFILHHRMHEVIQQAFPHRTLANADVIVFPDAPVLRVVVSEPNTDFFRDTAWHWRWIGLYLDRAAESPSGNERELDAYAAEELSEFLSVLGVAVVQLAARNLDSPQAPIGSQEIGDVLAMIESAETVSVPNRLARPVFSAEAKQQLLDSLPDPMFREVGDAYGLDYRHAPNRANWEKRSQLSLPLGIAGAGVSACDYDGDGDIDLYTGGDQAGALLQNQDGRFVDVSASAGLPRAGEVRGGYFADYDNDGDQDLLLTFVGMRNRLLENDGHGMFTDVSDQVGLLDEAQISHEAVWLDVNNDGLLDLYVASFGNWLQGNSPTIGRDNDNGGPNRLYMQTLRDGRRSFEEVGQQMHVDDRGWTHCVGAYDFDRDGWMDLFSLNDFGASLVYRNLGGMDFQEVSGALKMDDVYNAMNFTLMDVQHNGDLSIYVSQIMKLTHRQRYRRPSEDTAIVFDPAKSDNLRIMVNNRLFSRNGSDSFIDEHGVRIEPAELGWAWDVSAMDYENDTDLDLVVLNGTESSMPPANLRLAQADRTYQPNRNYLAAFDSERNVCFVQHEGYFYNVSAKNPIAYNGNSRGSAFFDLDNDGDLDAVISNYDERLRLFENTQPGGNHWIQLQLEGTRSNRNAVGAQVQIRFGDKNRFDQVVSGSGFLSQNPYALHFGLGPAEKVDEVIVRWPSGQFQHLTDLAADRTHTVREPQAALNSN